MLQHLSILSPQNHLFSQHISQWHLRVSVSHTAFTPFSDMILADSRAGGMKREKEVGIFLLLLPFCGYFSLESLGEEGHSPALLQPAEQP